MAASSFTSVRASSRFQRHRLFCLHFCLLSLQPAVKEPVGNLLSPAIVLPPEFCMALGWDSILTRWRYSSLQFLSSIAACFLLLSAGGAFFNLVICWVSSGFVKQIGRRGLQSSSLGEFFFFFISLWYKSCVKCLPCLYIINNSQETDLEIQPIPHQVHSCQMLLPP